MTTLEELEVEESKILEEMSKLNDSLRKLGKNRIKIRDKISNIKFGFEPTLEKICAIEDWNEVTGKEYNKISSYLRRDHSYIYQSGYDSDTGQIKFSLTELANPGDNWEKIEYLLTLIRPDKNGEKVIEITDYHCSEFGSYELINGTNIVITKYGRRSDIAEFDTIKEALQYIYTNLFANRNNSDDYDY